MRKHVVIVGGGFAGMNAAKLLGNKADVEVTLVDRKNHHLFQPLLYQVAMAGLSPAEIAAPIRSLLAKFKNIKVILGSVTDINLASKTVSGDFGDLDYDYLILACGAMHSYFGNNQWEPFAPGLKTLEQATEIRRRILTSFELAERTTNAKEQKSLLTFVIVGGGPTGVELAGAIGEMSRFTLAKDFRNIDPKLTRVILVEAGDRILPAFDPVLSSRAARDLEALGVHVWTQSLVTHVDAHGVKLGEENIETKTVLWAAGVEASDLGSGLNMELDSRKRVKVGPDLSIQGHPNVFVAGDQAHVPDKEGNPLPGIAPVAMQQGRYLARLILGDLKGLARKNFTYLDKGQMATIGRSKAVLESGPIRMKGFMAWMGWLVVHIYYLTGFKNRVFVVANWAWSYLSFKKGARLVLGKRWRLFNDRE